VWVADSQWPPVYAYGKPMDGLDLSQGPRTSRA
jgi:hypothetical protein